MAGEVPFLDLGGATLFRQRPANHYLRDFASGRGKRQILDYANRFLSFYAIFGISITIWTRNAQHIVRERVELRIGRLLLQRSKVVGSPPAGRRLLQIDRLSAQSRRGARLRVTIPAMEVNMLHGGGGDENTVPRRRHRPPAGRDTHKIVRHESMSGVEPILFL